jgi:3-deoxy-D-manno-octulosonate 8-phosphate phosphatase (KDO 8-P phosphatase)
MGDDILDLPVMTRCGLALAVADAHPQVRQRAHWISHCGGGQGAVREACEFLLRAQNKLEAAYAPYLG